MQFLIITILTWISVGQFDLPQPPTIRQLVDQWDSHVTQQDRKQSQESYQLVKSMLRSSDKSLMRQVFRVYAQYILYGLDEDYDGGIDYAKVYYYVKQSADLGDKSALSLMGILGTFKLDGTFNIIKNIEEKAQSVKQFVDDGISVLQPYRRIESFAKYHHLSTPMIDLYFAALQGSDEAALIMAFKYMKGLGTEQNCSNAALFMQPILQKHFIDSPSKDKMIFQNRRIDHILYNTETFSLATQWLDQEHVHIFEQLQQVTRDSVSDVLTLAYNFLYGINGVKRDYNKAYELFNKITQDTNNAQSMAFMAQMIVEGIAPLQVQDRDFAFHLYQESAKQNDSRGLNGLGYMYLNGLGVEKNTKKAMKYFQRSADLGNSDGHYNYGSLFMMPSSPDIDRNKRLAYTHLNIASAQGHAMAQYALSLIFLDGVDFFYSCELAIKLMHQASTRLHTANYVKQGNELFAKQKYPQALANYIQASLLGHRSAIGMTIINIFFKVNTAILADEFNAITNSGIQFDRINEILNRDDLYVFARQNSLPLQQIDDPLGYLFQDYISIMGDNDSDLDYAARYQSVKELLVPKKSIGQYVANKLFGYCKLEMDGYCFLRFGDFYYEGETEDQDYVEAYNQYRVASEAPDTPAVIQAHAYFNMGYIMALGLGKTQNDTLALKHFNASLTKHPLLPGMNAELVINLVQLFGVSNKAYFLERFELLSQKLGTSLILTLLHHKKQIMMTIVGFMIVIAYGAKLKAQNLMQ